jgi:colicin import membrane protein
LSRTITEIPVPPPPPPREEPPFYGWRYIERVRPDGKVEVETVLLTLEDVLHPQEGDVIPENSVHEGERRYLSDVCHAREARLDRGLVLSDCLVNWGVPGLGNHSPDISIFSGLKVRQPDPIGIFRLRDSGGECKAVIELVSPHTRSTDVEGKPPEYHRARVPLYIMVDQKKEGGPRQLRVFRHAPQAYIEETPESVIIPELGIRLGLRDNRVVCWDTETGEELGDYTAALQALEAAEQEARSEAQARQAAEQARQAAEQEAHNQAQARQAAEQEAHNQAQARQAAEQAQHAAEQARQNAEQLAREQARTAEERIRALEDRLQRLRENGT